MHPSPRTRWEANPGGKEGRGLHTYKAASDYLDSHPWIGVAFLVVLSVAYCWSALAAPYWVGNDAWSNLLPIVHYRISILEDHTLPLYTGLWYGGRYQWENPLWSFIYLPATIPWLIFPLDWGTRIVFLSHLAFSLLAGRKLAALFMESEVEKICAAIILTSPILPAFTAGETEKILSWGWVLLSLYFLLNASARPAHRGLMAGIFLGVLPITGSNYFALYAGIVLTLLAVASKHKALLGCLILGSLVALVHAPSVIHLIGQPRANAASSIAEWSMSLVGVVSSLAIGIARPIGWETWAPIGIPMLILLGKLAVRKIRASALTRSLQAISRIEKAWLVAIVVLVLLATGTLYRWQTFLDTFRVPARAVTFIALAVALLVFEASKHHGKAGERRLYLLASALQIGIVSFMIRPYGALYGPYDAGAQSLADALKADHAQSVWSSMDRLEGMDKLNSMYIQVVLTQNRIALPNVYYGDMGQEITIEGPHCGYSFDHIITLGPAQGGDVRLVPDIEWSDTSGWISSSNLSLIQEVDVNGRSYSVYRVVCSS